MEFSTREARRVALTAQGLGVRRPGDVKEVVAWLGAIQIDAVNVLARTQYLTIFSRLGPYDAGLLDGLVSEKREAFEYRGHAASILPIELYPLVRWRMARYAADKHWQAFQARVEGERPGYVELVLREVAERGPLTFGELSDPARRDKTQTRYAASTVLWERWSDGQTVLEGLYDAGVLAVAGRRGFERLYDLAERVIPPEVLSLPAPDPEEAQRALLLRAAAGLGVAAARDLADYFRMPMAATRKRLRELVDSGDLELASVQGWTEDCYVVPGVSAEDVDAHALLSPFDSLLWERDRTERLFGFRHSFELYVKAAKRQFGYFVLPFLLGDTLVGRVDLKADRKRAALLVLGAFAEPPASLHRVAGELAQELRRLARWLELDVIEVSDRGDLAPTLRGALQGE